MKITPLVWSLWTAHSSKQFFFFFETSKQAISCLHYTVHTGRNPNGTQNSTLWAERAHATTKRSFPAHYTTQADSTIHPWPISPYHKRPGSGSPTERFPRARVASRARSLRAYHSPPRPSPFALALAHLIPLAFPHLLAVAALASLGFRPHAADPPQPAMSKQGAFVSSFPLFPILRSGGIPLLFGADWLVFFSFSRVLTRRLCPGWVLLCRREGQAAEGAQGRQEGVRRGMLLRVGLCSRFVARLVRCPISE